MDNDRLQKIDEIVKRTNASYETAKNALEEAGDDVLEAIIIIENQNKFSGSNSSGNFGGSSYAFDAKQKGEQIIDEMKKILKKGNAAKITIKRNNETIVNIPVTAGIVGALLAPFLAAAGVTAALLTECTVEIMQADGQVIDVNEKVEDGMKNVKSTMEDVKKTVNESAQKFKQSFDEGANDIKNSFNESAEDIKNNFHEAADDIKNDFNIKQ